MSIARLLAWKLLLATSRLPIAYLADFAARMVPIAFWLFMAIIANINRGGSKPGERRGGRKKGSLNKATIERA